MTRAAVVALAACAHAAPPAPAAPPPAVAPAPAPPPPPPPDACAQDAAKIQPMLDANAALFAKWRDAVDLDPEPLPPATDELEPVTVRVPAIAVSPHKILMFGLAGSARSVAYRVRALAGRDAMARSTVALAIARDTPWIEVVELMHALQLEGLGHVKILFAVDRSAVRVPDNPIAEKLRGPDSIEAARQIGADFAARCPAIANLFVRPTVDELQRFAREAAPALASCHCAVSASEAANLYAALMVPPYVAARTLALSRTGTEIAASKTATFADVTRWIVGLPADAPAAFVVR